MSDKKSAPRKNLLHRFFPESQISGFTHICGTVTFYSQIASILHSETRLLDFGAGRGEPISDDPNAYRRSLTNFQGRVAHVAGCDIDPVVHENPFLDSAATIKLNEPLPYEDESFDVIVARSVFEHVDNPNWTAEELMRILRPGGVICVTTPNRWGYVAILASLVPNSLHTKVLSRVQPNRKPEDVFPTRYKMNTLRKLRNVFQEYADVLGYYFSPEPAYHFNSTAVFATFLMIHKLLPSFLQTHLYAFIRKR